MTTTTAVYKYGGVTRNGMDRRAKEIIGPTRQLKPEALIECAAFEAIGDRRKYDKVLNGKESTDDEKRNSRINLTFTFSIGLLSYSSVLRFHFRRYIL